ncbi:DNA adenine methylase [Phascolarctobacterium faecium]|jgi:adenine-specific DNA-methyltransferase|uniref:DNA adenine methylase n=1 Tax=Phascolarctobacterium faecium TaxID=33025 RepID=UPI00258B2397|nr:DNA adenine methylase [uncultured Phascolarctobacterium sp.]
MRFIGCKTLLLDKIKEVIDENAPEAKTLCDIFSGTSVVSRYFKQWYEITSNDILFFSYVLQRATVENDALPSFSNLIPLGITDPVQYFNEMDISAMETLENEKRFFQNTYAPKGGRMYVNDENALRIDYARNTVEDWYQSNLIDDDEYYYLIACIVEGIPFVSNISGTYGAFHKEWERRSFKKFELFKLEVFTNGKENRCFNEDGVELLKRISGDVLYIDPPYNGRQYLPNYHVLETAAKYDYPKVRGVTAQRPYENNKSDFCLKSKVVEAFSNLIKNAKYEHIILSYSTDGLMSVADIESIMKKHGIEDTFRIYEIPYRRYKSRTQEKKDELKELLIYVRKTKN